MATLTVTVSESITLQGKNQGTSNTTTIASIVEIYRRIMAVDNSASVVIYTCGTSTKAAGSAFDSDDIKYVRMTNIGAQAINIKIIGTGNDTIWHQLIVGGTLLLFDHSASLEASGSDVAHGAVSLADISQVKAKGIGGAGKLEVIIANA